MTESNVNFSRNLKGNLLLLVWTNLDVTLLAVNITQHALQIFTIMIFTIIVTPNLIMVVASSLTTDFHVPLAVPNMVLDILVILQVHIYRSEQLYL